MIYLEIVLFLVGASQVSVTSRGSLESPYPIFQIIVCQAPFPELFGDKKPSLKSWGKDCLQKSGV